MGTETLWEGANQEPARRPGRLRAWASASGPTTPRPGELVGVEGTWIEGLLGAVSGFAFGFVGTSLGHPADTIKTKMQADPRFSRRNAIFVLRATLKQDGLLALYRGFLPPLIGGSCFCSAVFGAYSSTFSACEGSVLMDPVGGTGYRPAVFLASISAAAARTAIETPFELVKTKMQLGIKVFPDAPGFGKHTALSLLQQSYRGFTVTFLRNTLLLSTMFSVLDWTTRAAPDVVGAPVIGPFLKGAVCNTVGWFVAWPFELLKSKVQGDPTGMLHRKPILTLFSDVVKSDGVKGLWRGYALGGARSFVVNGFSMLAYQQVLDLRRNRDEAARNNLRATL